VTEYVVEEVDGDFVIPIAGFACVAHDDGYLIVRGQAPDDEARIVGLEGPIASQLAATGIKIVRAVATADSTLRIDFDGDISVEVPASGEYEAWEVVGPGRVHIESPAGGGEPDIWGGDPRATSYRYDGHQWISQEYRKISGQWILEEEGGNT
jgi:hypothetical protein